MAGSVSRSGLDAGRPHEAPRGIHRILQKAHVMMGEVFTLLDQGNVDSTQAETVQFMKAFHQCAIYEGSWLLA